MWQLIIGVLIWIDGHSFRLFAPKWRQKLREKYGDKIKMALAVYLLIGIIFMIWGYRIAPVIEIYTPPTWGKHLAMLTLTISIALFGAGNSKSHMRNIVRHPMLTGMAIWAASHLLVRGDLASIILFGGLGVWAIGSIFLINMREGEWIKNTDGISGAGNIRLAVITIALTGIIILIHHFSGLIY